MNEEIMMCASVMLAWSSDAEAKKECKFDEEYNSQSFIARMIRKKIDVFRIPIRIPDYLLMIVEICTDSNPGVSQVMLKEIISKIPNLEYDHLITPEDLARVYPMDFPTMSNPKWEKHFHDLWDQQKSEGFNKCDIRDWWMEPFVS